MHLLPVVDGLRLVKHDVRLPCKAVHGLAERAEGVQVQHAAQVVGAREHAKIVKREEHYAPRVVGGDEVRDGLVQQGRLADLLRAENGMHRMLAHAPHQLGIAGPPELAHAPVLDLPARPPRVVQLHDPVQIVVVRNAHDGHRTRGGVGLYILGDHSAFKYQL